MAEPNAGLYRTLSLAAVTLRLSVTAAHWLGSCSCRVILFGVHNLLPRSHRYLMLLKPDRVDILETVKWIALCLKCEQ